ncbi:DUF2158 domain-containing protein [Variovorax sp. KBW07]|nr:DUF2158 domain-containing protein [Variovorax sp. KBW07]
MLHANVGVQEDRMATFNVGDRVMLKSGSPVMTVSSELGHDGKVQCNYFNGAELKIVRLDPKTLEAYKNE